MEIPELRFSDAWIMVQVHPMSLLSGSAPGRVVRLRFNSETFDSYRYSHSSNRTACRGLGYTAAINSNLSHATRAALRGVDKSRSQIRAYSSSA